MVPVSFNDVKDAIEHAKSLRIALTYDCPLDCMACYARKNRSTASMSPKLFEKLVMEGKNLGFNTVAIGGGEPLSKMKLLIDCIKIAKQHGYDASVTSSGYNLTDRSLEKLVNAGLDFFQLSLGYNRVTFDDKLGLLARNHAEFGVNFLVDKEHVDQLPSIHDQLWKEGARYVVYVTPKAMEDRANCLRFKRDDLERYLHVLVQMHGDFPDFPFLVDCTTSIFTGTDCPGTSKGISIAPSGKISFCAFCGHWTGYGGSLTESMACLERAYDPRCRAMGKFLAT